jgi:hypothetical protein
MQFGLTDEQRMMQEMAKDFAQKEIPLTSKTMRRITVIVLNWSRRWLH